MQKKSDDALSIVDIAYSTIELHKEYLIYAGSEQRRQRQIEAE